MSKALCEKGSPSVTRDSVDCLDLDTLGALAEGSLDAQARAELLPHLASCARCRSELASIARALAAPEIAAELRGAGVPRANRWWRVAVPVAAAALLLLLIRPALIRTPPIGPHRDPVLTNGTAPAGIAPAGTVATVSRLLWKSVQGADRYRVTLFDAGGRVLYEVEPLDTLATLPDSVRLSPGQRYLWRVDARVGFDRWVASQLIEFTVSRDGQ
jgi:hypothetical protein